MAATTQSSGWSISQTTGISQANGDAIKYLAYETVLCVPFFDFSLSQIVRLSYDDVITWHNHRVAYRPTPIDTATQSRIK